MKANISDENIQDASRVEHGKSKQMHHLHSLTFRTHHALNARHNMPYQLINQQSQVRKPLQLLICLLHAEALYSLGTANSVIGTVQ
jgi:hypothetical protein